MVVHRSQESPAKRRIKQLYPASGFRVFFSMVHDDFVVELWSEPGGTRISKTYELGGPHLDAEMQERIFADVIAADEPPPNWPEADPLLALDRLERVCKYLRKGFSLSFPRDQAQAYFDTLALLLKVRMSVLREAEAIWSESEEA